MRILFDLLAVQPYGETRFHGGGEYTKLIFFKLIENIAADDIIDVFWDAKIYIDEEIKEICYEKRINNVGCITDEEISQQLTQYAYDSFFSGLPYRYSSLVIPERTTFIYTIHGLRRLELPIDSVYYQYSSTKLKGILKRLINFFFKTHANKDCKHQFDNINKLFSLTKNQLIITDSYHSKYSIINFFENVPIDKLEVFYCPEKESTIDNHVFDEKILRKYNVTDKKYILIISANRWEKNAIRGVIALDSLFTRRQDLFEKDFKVLILGATNENIFTKHIKNVHRFILRGYVEEKELNCLYSHAHLFLYPSLNEGFGYPPLEAIKRGTLCACAADTSIPEVCGNAALYFKPDDLMEISNRVLQSFDITIQNEMYTKMEKRYSEISEKQNKDTLKLISRILHR